VKRIRLALTWTVVGALALAILTPLDSSHADPLKDRLKSPVPKSPVDALKTFQVQDGFRMELVAHEPQVTSPVAAAYDEDGRLFVVEMRDYPHPLKPGDRPIGRVRLLEDKNDDGVYESATVFADGLAWPTGVCCWDGGVFVTAAPDIWYFKDTTGDGIADVRKKVFTGFVVYNVQALVNGLQWGVDNGIYGVTAGNGGEIRPADTPAARPVSVRGRDFRFDPRSMSFEAISGTAQFGNAFDNWYNRFLCANRMIAGHVVLPSHALARNPAQPVSRVVHDCAAEGENVPIPMFQISAAEPWRAVRTERYHTEGQKLPQSEMVAKGVFTSGTGITIYRGSAYPETYRGQAFLGNPAGNLIHRRTLTARDVTFVATRADKNCEFIASTDNWFRPVNFVNAPDGTLHVLDMYREVVEHPWSIPDDIKAHLDLSSGRDRGRIYRIAPPGFKHPAPPRLSKATTAELVACLENPNAWWRETAQRLLYQRQDKEAAPALRKLVAQSESPLARLHALWALDGLGALEDRDILAASSHRTAALREHALRLAETRIAKSTDLVALAKKLTDDADRRVRFQAAITLGAIADDSVVRVLVRLLGEDGGDPYMRVAVISSISDRELKMVEALLADREFAASSKGTVLVQSLAATIGARGKAGEPEALLKRLAARDASRFWSSAVRSLGEGLLRTGQTLQALKIDPNSTEGKLLAAMFQSEIRTAAFERTPISGIVRAIPVLVHAPFADTKPVFDRLLDPAKPAEVQLAVVRALRSVPSDEVPALLLKGWKSYTPAVRSEALTTLTSRPAWSVALMDAITRNTVSPADLGPVTRAMLISHRDPKIKDRAIELLGKPTNAARADVIATYKPVLDQKGDAARGLAVFKRECANCHFAAGVGTSIGPAIAAIGTRTPDALLTAILDPNREVDPRYLTYTVHTSDGRTLSGIITAETATTVTLRRADGVDVVLRSRIEELRSSGVSLMPEGVEKSIPPNDMADLLAFLATVK
jgi:putative membrane-bound dehydrogenase-like protein